MLILSYLGEAKQFDLTVGVNLLAVRNPPTEKGRIKIPPNFIHVPQLSPSRELFIDTQTWKEEFDKKEAWWHLYEARFLKELHERKDMVRALSRLDQRLRAGELIRLFCYCKDVCYCHRSFVGRDMEGRGHSVDFRRIPKSEQLSLF
ncbi:DUF488 family protein [Brevibacillus sp. NPDC058079]|uniref:DUF488 family protein, N3 subclade n=1 Tax=Brevibacillus sp. NPDC058079 TaxID=3346330 RepID=UPI0036F03729